MTVNDLPEPLRHLGGQPYNGEKVNHTFSEKHWKNLEPMLLERLLEEDKKESA